MTHAYAPPVPPVEPVAAEDQARANVYGLLGALLARAPSADLLGALCQLNVDDAGDAPMKPAWSVLQHAAAQATVDTAADEYQDLFIGIGRGELVPYGSWYLTGFLMEKPLAELRADLQRLGFERQDTVREPEDHAAALCETMGMMAVSGGEISFEQQREFFCKHMAPWLGRFFADLATAGSARFYRAVGVLGGQFMDVERTYFAMPV